MVVIGTRRVSAAVGSVVALVAAVLIAAPDASAATLVVNAGGDLQAALNAAQPGDVIVLQAGARFVGEFKLPVKPSGPVITIRSSGVLPERRVTPADASLMASISSGNPMSALDGTGAANWKLDGLRFESTSTGEGEIIALQDAVNITMDRLLIVGGSNGQKRAIRGNGQKITLTRSHIANIWRYGQESQGFCAWDGAGPYTIVDNYLEVASESIMFGGANSLSPARVPADILVERNHMTKRLEWRGQGKVVKNLFELKQAKRATIRNNLMENNWTDAQAGWAIQVTVRNDEGGSPWAVIEDVLFEKNIVRGSERGVAVLGYNDGSPSGQTTRVTFRDNLFVVSDAFLLIGGEAGVLRFEHNTIDQGGTFLILATGEIWPAGTTKRAATVAVENLTIINNLANHGEYGVFGDGIGTSALTQFTKTYTFTHNVLAGEAGWGRTYPYLTLQPAMAEHKAQFNPDYTLVTSSSYRGAGNDGRDLGGNWSASGTVGPATQPPTTAPPPPPPPPVPALTLIMDPASMPVGTVNQTFAGVKVKAQGGQGPYRITGMNLLGWPSSLRFDDRVDPIAGTAEWHGLVTREGQFPVVMTVEDAAGQKSELQIVFNFVAAPAPPPPPPSEVCGNGIDDDKDGLIDEGCAPPPPPPAEVCGNGIDDDKDGLIDEGCAPPPPPVEVCGNGIDDDKDGLTDEGCIQPPAPVEVCGNGIDDDRDGLIDEGCAPPSPPPAEVCGDRIDNDGDGLIDEGCSVGSTADTTGPTVTIRNERQNANYYKFRLEGSDPSGIASVTVRFNGAKVHDGTTVPVDIDVPLRTLPSGTYSLDITVTDSRGNQTTVNRFIKR